MELIKIAVLITCYNRCSTTIKCLQHLEEQVLPANIAIDVYLVDDGSSDYTGDRVRELYPDINVLEGSGNLYWNGGMRLAWKVAAQSYNYDAYIWLNDDTMMNKDAIKILVDTSEHVFDNEGIPAIVVGSSCDSKTGEHSYGGRIKRKRSSKIPDLSVKPSFKPVQCDTMNGNLVLIPKQIFKNIGGLSGDFTHAFGDVDYGMRARENGFSIWVAPGYLAECEANTRKRVWTDCSEPFSVRIKDMRSPLGLPPRQWMLYVRRHTGLMWPIYFLKPIIRVVFPQLWTNNKV